MRWEGSSVSPSSSASRGWGSPGWRSRWCVATATRSSPSSPSAYPLGATASLAPWTEAIERHLRSLEPESVRSLAGPYLDDLASMLPSVAASARDGSRTGPRTDRVLAGLAMLLGALSEELPVVVVLDDVHLADGSSWEALSYLARNLDRCRVLLVLAARPVELGEPRPRRDRLALEQDERLRRYESRRSTARR